MTHVRIVNCTKYKIKLFDPMRGYELTIVPDRPAYLVETHNYVHDISTAVGMDIPVRNINFGAFEVKDLPAQKTDTFYIVDRIIAIVKSMRNDLLFPVEIFSASGVQFCTQLGKVEKR